MPRRRQQSRRLPSVRSARLISRFMPASNLENVPQYPRWHGGGEPRRIIALGDLQRTILAERVYLARRQNDRVREALLSAVAAEHPDVLLLLGDQVADGASLREWAYFDQLMHAIRKGSTAVHAIPGNHDYSSFDREASVRQFLTRFPGLRNGPPELARFGRLALVGLDSNFLMLGGDGMRRQGEAYRALLRTLDQDPGVAGIIVASHHPAYSNSALRKTDPVIEMFAGPFLEASKSMLFLSAHVHAYERFTVDGREFVTSGGGGGPRRRVDVSAQRRWHHDSYKGATVRPFHYVRLTPCDDSLLLETIMLEGDEPTRRRAGQSEPLFEVGDRVVMGYR